jgi:hypothetical protein
MARFPSSGQFLCSECLKAIMGKKIKSGDVSASTEYKFSCATCVSRRDAHQQRFEQREGPRCDARQLGLIFTRHCLRCIGSTIAFDVIVSNP